MPRIYRYLVPIVVLTLLTGAALAAPTATSPTPVAHRMAATATAVDLVLPAPTGRHPVGLSTVHLRDPDRADPWVPADRRELMVSVWYPAAPRDDAPPARYVTAEESALILRQLNVTGLPADTLSAVRTHATVQPPLRPGPGRLPLVVLSPGFTYPRSSLTVLAQELASHGYVVAGVDHNHEAAAITFPDGRITDCLACRSDADPVAATAGRSRDVSFVIDRLTAARPAWWGGHRIDPRRIAMVGHSLGGAAAAAAMRDDRRIRLGVNIDGTFQAGFNPDGTPLPGLPPGFDRPFLMLGAERHGQPGADVTWDVTWPSLAGWRRWISVDGTTHSSFVDYPALAEQVGLSMQPLPGSRCAEITNAFVTAAVDRHLRGRPAPLLAGPTSSYPEVRSWQP